MDIYVYDVDIYNVKANVLIGVELFLDDHKIIFIIGSCIPNILVRG